MAPTSEEFIDAVLERLGLSQTELGVKLRKSNAYQTVHGWKTGKLRLGYEDTMAMLELCGWLNIDSPGGATTADPLESLAASVDRILANQEEGLKIVRAIRRAQDPRKAKDRSRSPGKAARTLPRGQRAAPKPKAAES